MDSCSIKRCVVGSWSCTCGSRSGTTADGSTVRYVALARNCRIDGQIKPEVLMNLGRVDQLDLEGLRRLAASIDKHFGEGGGISDAAEAGLGTGAAPLRVVESRRSGRCGCSTGYGSG